MMDIEKLINGLIGGAVTGVATNGKRKARFEQGAAT